MNPYRMSLIDCVSTDLFYSAVQQDTHSSVPVQATELPSREREFIDHNIQQNSSVPYIYSANNLQAVRRNSHSSAKCPTDLDEERARRLKARRTAHSKIERRRRIKMNEQFEQLKHLIPACNQFSSATRNESGLHKCVILEEAVKYITYLKGKKNDNDDNSTTSPSICSPFSYDTNESSTDKLESSKKEVSDLLLLTNDTEQASKTDFFTQENTVKLDNEPESCLKIANLLS